MIPADPALFYRSILDTMPHPVMVVDDDVRIIDANTAALELVRSAPLALNRRSGEALHCIHASESPKGCGGAPACRTCVIRNSVSCAFKGDRVSRRAHHLEFIEWSGSKKSAYILVTTAPIQAGEERLVLLVLEDISDMIFLRGIVPICAGCRKVRTEDEFWVNVEAYFRNKLNIDFSHGICPDCLERMYPDELK